MQLFIHYFGSVNIVKRLYFATSWMPSKAWANKAIRCVRFVYAMCVQIMQILLRSVLQMGQAIFRT